MSKGGGKITALWAISVTNHMFHPCRCWRALQVAPHHGGLDLVQLPGGEGHGVPLLQKGELCPGDFSPQKDGMQRWNHVYVSVTPSLGELPKEELFSSWSYKYNGVFIQVSLVHKHGIMVEGTGSSSFIQRWSFVCVVLLFFFLTLNFNTCYVGSPRKICTFPWNINVLKNLWLSGLQISFFEKNCHCLLQCHVM